MEGKNRISPLSSHMRKENTDFSHGNMVVRYPAKEGQLLSRQRTSEVAIPRTRQRQSNSMPRSSQRGKKRGATQRQQARLRAWGSSVFEIPKDVLGARRSMTANKNGRPQELPPVGHSGSNMVPKYVASLEAHIKNLLLEGSLKASSIEACKELS